WYGRMAAGNPMEVRLRAFDKAGNMGQAVISAGLTGDGRPVEASSSGSFAGGASTAFRKINYRNKYLISFDYEMPKIPDSGLSAFDLWYTKDEGKTWAPAPKKEGAGSPAAMPTKPGGAIASAGTLVFDTNNVEGLFGFRIVARNGIHI